MSQRQRQRSGSLTGQRLLDGDNEEGRTAGIYVSRSELAGSVRVFRLTGLIASRLSKISLQDSLSTQLINCLYCLRFSAQCPAATSAADFRSQLQLPALDALAVSFVCCASFEKVCISACCIH